jgi:nitronate monooxygenase
MNFFCHTAVDADPAREAGWKRGLALTTRNWRSIPQRLSTPPTARRSMRRCARCRELKPEVVSFHFGLPDPALVKRVKAAGSS